MTPTTVYFILQLDNIRMSFLLICAAAFTYFFMLRFIASIGNAQAIEDAQKEYWKPIYDNSPPWSRALAAAIVWALVGGFMPDTQTGAAAVIAPQIANSAIVQRDIPELYSLAIGKLKSALGAETKVEAAK